MKKRVKIIILVAIIILLVVTTVGVGVGFYFWNNNSKNSIVTGKKDDWVFKGTSNSSWFSGMGLNSNMKSSIQSTAAGKTSGMLFDTFTATSTETSGISSNASSDTTLGYSVGGSKNITNFRENIKNGFFPISTDITYNGLFYDYYFNTGKTKENNELFSPSYSMAISKDPISGEKEYYMTVGLNSNIKMSDFKRKKQNLMIVLDISGSMSSSLNSYYYDGSSRSIDENKSKMQLANEAVNLLIDELKDDDRFGIVLFDDESYLAKPMNLVKETDIEKIKSHVLDIKENGGTNFEAGYTKATESFTKQTLNDDEYDNRIIVITDAMPNLGVTSKAGLSKYIKDNAENKIYTSFIGVGIDFNTDVIETLSNVRGANYYSISSNEQFKKILGEDFEYMVTPLVFDLNLNFESDTFELEEVYGTDNADKTKGNIISVNTLFPASTNSTSETKGGVILLKLKKKNNELDGKIKLKVSYSDRDDKKYSNEEAIQFIKDNDFYANTGIRKAIVLVRYANSLKNWILYERTNKDEFIINEETGITDCLYTKDEIYRKLGIYERTSLKLSVSDEYKEIFSKLKEYIENEKNELEDDDLKQEVELLSKLIK